MFVINATFEDSPPRLVTALDLIGDEDDAFASHLSPADARLAVEMAERRAEGNRRLRESVARLHRENPDLEPGELVPKVLQEVLGPFFNPAPTPEPKGGGRASLGQEPKRTPAKKS
jgi:hypothetical protein